MQLVNEGSYCSIFKLVKSNDIIAVKVIKKTEYSPLILKEKCLLSELSCKNIVNLKLCNLGDFDNANYFCMEYIDGGNLADVIHSSDNIYTKNEALNWILQISNALLYLAEALEPPVAHLDIKPENFLIKSDLKCLKLCDFNTCHYGDIQVFLMGTVPYRDPQIIMYTNKEYKSESLLHLDIYSFAVVIIELTTRKCPLKDIFSEIMLITEHLVAPDILKSMVESNITERITIKNLCQQFQQYIPSSNNESGLRDIIEFPDKKKSILTPIEVLESKWKSQETRATYLEYKETNNRLKIKLKKQLKQISSKMDIDQQNLLLFLYSINKNNF